MTKDDILDEDDNSKKIENDVSDLAQIEIQADEEIPQESIERMVELIAKVEKQSYFEGPIPPPDILAEYNNALPGAANRILKMAEKQLEHRHQQEKTLLESDIFRSKLGLYLGFIITLVFALLGAALIYFEQEVTGLVSMMFPLVSLVGVFIYVLRKQQKDKNDKASED